MMSVSGLTSQMELKMKEICAGTKTRNDVVHESLEQYREVFIKTSQQIDVLKAVSRCIPHALYRMGLDIAPTVLQEVHLQ